MSEPVLDVRNLQVRFATPTRPIIAVDRISFTLNKGEVLGIVGESGSGKSVTSLALMGLIAPPGKITQGEIWFRAQDNHPTVDLLTLSEDKRRHYRGKSLAMIFQEPMSSLNPVYNIGFQIIEAIKLHQNVTPEQAKCQAIALLQEVRLLPSDQQLEQKYLEKLPTTTTLPLTQQIKAYIEGQKRAILKRYPHELSGGQLQRVMTAIAISSNPQVLIADEPTTALDVTVQATILKLLRDLCKAAREMSMIFISHDLGVIANIADTVAVMYKGKIVEYNSIEKILWHPQHPYTQGLLACRPDMENRFKKLPTVSDYLEEQDSIIIAKKPPVLEVITDEEEKERVLNLQQQETILSVKDLRVHFPLKGVFGQTKDFFKAVDGVTFGVKKGETVGLVGESGCGKSTLARAILRLIPATGGEIEFRAVNISRLKIGSPELRFLRKEIQIIFQNPYNSLNPRLTIGQAIIEPLIIHNQGGSPQQRRQRMAYLLERVKLNPHWFNRYPHELSGGQRQRVCIARALALNPQFIICDESVSALDVSVQAEVLNLLKELQQEFDLTYIFISHDLSVVRFMSDRILVMNRGKIEEMGTAQSIIHDPQQDYTQRLIASIPKFPQSML